MHTEGRQFLCDAFAFLSGYPRVLLLFCLGFCLFRKLEEVGLSIRTKSLISSAINWESKHLNATEEIPKW